MVAMPDASIFKLLCKKLLFLHKSLKMEGGEGGRKDKGKEERTEGRQKGQREGKNRNVWKGEERGKNDKKRKDFFKDREEPEKYL